MKGSRFSDSQILAILKKAEIIQEWMYNNDRPNMALGGITPQQKLAFSGLGSTSGVH